MNNKDDGDRTVRQMKEEDGDEVLEEDEGH